MSTNAPLPRVAPEEVGIRTAGIVSFIDELRQSGQEVHSFMLLRHGAVAAEAWWKPYAPELRHMLFSLSKSFTSTAVGLAVAEGLLTVDDPVLRFFPDQAPRRRSPNLGAMRVRHLLSMCTGHEKDTLERVTKGKGRDWVKTILSLPVEKEPGSLFVYNSGASYLLSAIVQKLTGRRLLDYLTPRLFEPLGIAGATWERCPRGIDAGGWGLSITTEDIAKFGLLYLRTGMWGERRILPESWVEEATRSQISNGDGGESDWAQGYGFQFWRCRHGAYRGDGAFGQLCVVMPAEDAVLAMTSGAQDMQAILNAAWGSLLPAMGEAGRVVKKRERDLRRAVRVLKLDPPEFRDDPEAATAINGARFELEANEGKLRSIDFALLRGKLVARVKGRRTNSYRFGAGRWVPGRVRPEASHERVSQPVRCAYRWREDGALELTVRAITTPFRETWVLRFQGESLEMTVSANVSFGPQEHPPIRGRRSV